MYARTKAHLPHAQRMENLTWRMMALALRKKREEEARKECLLETAATSKSEASTDSKVKKEVQKSAESGSVRLAEEPSKELLKSMPAEENAPRGRRIDKGKTKMRVEGFDDGKQDEECVVPSFFAYLFHTLSRH